MRKAKRILSTLILAAVAGGVILWIILNTVRDHAPAEVISPSNSFILSDKELEEARIKAMQGDIISMEKMYLHYDFEDAQDSAIKLEYWHEQIRNVANAGDPEAVRFFDGVKERELKKN